MGDDRAVTPYDDSAAASTVKIVQDVADILHGGTLVSCSGQQAVVRLNVSGGQGNGTSLSWFFQVAADGSASVYESQSPESPSGQPNATITVTHDTFHGIVAGRVSVMRAYWG